jgi:hypothetical protein
MILLGILSFVSVSKTLFRKGNFPKPAWDSYEKMVQEEFQNKIRPLVHEVTQIFHNRQFFYYLCLEDLVAALKCYIDTDRAYKITKKGWTPFFQSSKKQIIRLGELYKDLYGTLFTFAAALLITYLVIKKDFYYRVQENKVEVVQEYEQEEIKRAQKALVSQNLKIEYEGKEKTYFSLNRLWLDSTDEIVDKKAKETLLHLEEMNKMGKYQVIDDKILNIFKQFPLEYWREMQVFKEFFVQKLKEGINYKYLENNGFNFRPKWVIPDIRNNFAHAANFRIFKQERGEYAMKIVNSRNSTQISQILQVEDLRIAVIKIKVLNKYLLGAFLSTKYAYQDSGAELCKVDLLGIKKSFEKTSTSIH